MGSAGPFCWFAGYPHDGGPLVARLGGVREPCLCVCWLGRQTSSHGSCVPKAAKEKEGTRASVSQLLLLFAHAPFSKGNHVAPPGVSVRGD